MGQREALLVIALVSFAIPIQVIWKKRFGNNFVSDGHV